MINFPQIIVSETPLGALQCCRVLGHTVLVSPNATFGPSGARNQWVLGAGCQVPPYFSSLCPLGKMKVLASLTIRSSWNFDNLFETCDFSLRLVGSLFWILWLEKWFSPFWCTLCITLFALFCMFLLFDYFMMFYGWCEVCLWFSLW